MKTRLVLAAAATALTLGAVMPVTAPVLAADRGARSLSQVDARKAIETYYARQGQDIRIRRSWVKDNHFYARVVSRYNDPVATVRVNLATGRISVLRR